MIRRSTWVLLGVLAIVSALAWYLQRENQEADLDVLPTTGVEYLFQSQGASIISLTITDDEGTRVSVARNEEGAWDLVDPVEEEADSGRIESAVMQAESLRVLATIEESLDLAVVGLDPPRYTIEVAYEDGHEEVAYVGDRTPTDSGFYAYVGNSPLKVVNKFGMDGILEIHANLPLMPTPVPTTILDLDESEE